MQHFGGMNGFRSISIEMDQVKFGREVQNNCPRKRYGKCTKTKGGSNWKAEKCLGF